MKIRFERNGGILGRQLCTEVNTDELAPEKALPLLEAVEGADFFTLPEQFNGLESVGGGDQMSYKVTVEVAGVEHTVEASDETVPPRLEPLLSELSRWARTDRQGYEPPGTTWRSPG